MGTKLFTKQFVRAAEKMLWGIALILLLASCSNGTASLSYDDYKETVLVTLRGDRLADSGLDQIIDITLGDLGCTGEHCIDRFRFQFLRDEVGPRKGLVADYRARICKPEIVPPASELTDHKLICDEMQKFFNSLDAVGKNSGDALKLTDPSGAKNSASQILLESFSKRIDKEREKIAQIRIALQEVDLLKSLFIQ